MIKVKLLHEERADELKKNIADYLRLYDSAHEDSHAHVDTILLN